MNPFFIIFIGIPALEIFLLIKIGEKIGALNTISLIFLTALIGVYFARLQGIKTLKSGMVNLYQNKIINRFEIKPDKTSPIELSK